MALSHYVQVILALSIFIAVIYAILQVSKVAVKKRFTGEMKLKDRLPLDNQVCLAMVEVRGKTYLFGVSNSQIEVIEKYED